MSLTGGQPNFARCLAVSSAGTLYMCFWGLCLVAEFCQVQNSLCVQVLFSLILAALLHGTPAAGVSWTLWHGTRNGNTELSQRALPIYGWAAITLGIDPHSSCVYFVLLYISFDSWMHAFVVLGLVFSYQAKRLAWGTSPKWLILCRMGRKTTTHSMAVQLYICADLSTWVAGDELVVVAVWEGRHGDGRLLCHLHHSLDGTELPQAADAVADTAGRFNVQHAGRRKAGSGRLRASSLLKICCMQLTICKLCFCVTQPPAILLIRATWRC